MGGRRLIDLLAGPLPGRDRVARTTAEYLAHYDRQAGPYDRNGGYERAVTQFYDLVTDFYEYGWGESFHFAPRYPGESFGASLARHEHFIALRLGLGPGMRIIDLGCGVGGPGREIARLSGATVVGTNVNDYQLVRARELTRHAGLEHRCSFVKCDFMELALEPASFDAAYAIESALHATDRTRFCANVLRVLKPGGLFAGYDWCVTGRYDARDAEHRAIKSAIVRSNGLYDLVDFDAVLHALRAAGFDVIEARDVALDSHPGTPWYGPLQGRVSFTGFRHTGAGRKLTAGLLRLLEAIRVAPPGAAKVARFLDGAARAIVRGGELGVFTPMFFFLARRPS